MQLYKLDFPNGKCYIGITSRTAKKRFEEHCRASQNKSPVQKAIHKYGTNNVVLTVLATIDNWELLCLAEMEAIKKYDTFNRQNGYNLTLGGEGTSTVGIYGEQRLIRDKGFLKAYRDANNVEIKAKDAAYKAANKAVLKVKAKIYFQLNKEEISIKKKAYHEKNRLAAAEYKKEWRKTNKERLKDKAKTYHKENQEKILTRVNEWSEANKDKVKANKKAWYEANKDKVKARSKINKQKRNAKKLAELLIGIADG